MAALLSVWLGLACLVLSLVMVAWRPAFNDVTLLLDLYFGCPGSICLAGMVLWSHRKTVGADRAIAAQRVQAKVAIGLALVAAAIVYGLVMAAEPVEVPSA